MADSKMVVVNGVRYRAEDAPKGDGANRDEKPAEHKMRTPRKSTK